MNRKVKVKLLPTPICEGWVSMNHYWSSLCTVFEKDESVTSILGTPELGQPPLNTFVRVWVRLFWYHWKIRKCEKVDVFHVLDHSYADLLRFIPSSIKKVVTVHDLIPLTEESTLDPARRARFAKRVSYLEKADLLLCVSQFTADEVHRILGIPQSKLRVVPMGVDAEYLEIRETGKQVVPVRDGRKPLLVVGSAIPRKNLESIPALLDNLPDQNYTVVKVGRPFPENVAELIRAKLGGNEGLLEMGFVSAEDLPQFYAQSFVLLFPSFLEGFGLPVLEAMAVGCPVLCSDRASLPEVGGDCVAYFNPDHPEEGAKALRRLVEDDDYREELIGKGRERARSLTWTQHAEKLREVYDSFGE